MPVMLTVVSMHSRVCEVREPCPTVHYLKQEVIFVYDVLDTYLIRSALVIYSFSYTNVTD